MIYRTILLEFWLDVDPRYENPATGESASYMATVNAPLPAGSIRSRLAYYPTGLNLHVSGLSNVLETPLHGPIYFQLLMNRVALVHNWGGYIHPDRSFYDVTYADIPFVAGDIIRIGTSGYTGGLHASGGKTLAVVMTEVTSSFTPSYLSSAHHFIGNH